MSPMQNLLLFFYINPWRVTRSFTCTRRSFLIWWNHIAPGRDVQPNQLSRFTSSRPQTCEIEKPLGGNKYYAFRLLPVSLCIPISFRPHYASDFTSLRKIIFAGLFLLPRVPDSFL